jgi:hypothetical protein
MNGLSILASQLRVPLAVGEQNFAGFPAIHQYLASGVGFPCAVLISAGRRGDLADDRQAVR